MAGKRSTDAAGAGGRRRVAAVVGGLVAAGLAGGCPAPHLPAVAAEPSPLVAEVVAAPPGCPPEGCRPVADPDPTDDADDDETTEIADPTTISCLSNRGSCAENPITSEAPTASATAPPDLRTAPVAIAFPVGRANLDAVARDRLDATAARLRDHPELELIEVAGQVERTERGRGLAAARARTVHAYLVARGVAAERLVVTEAAAGRRQVALTVRLAVDR